MTFNEANTVEAFVRDLLCGGVTDNTIATPGLARTGNQISGLGWHYLSHHDLPRQPQEALVEKHLSEALIRLNPTIAAQPNRGRTRKDAVLRQQSIWGCGYFLRQVSPTREGVGRWRSAVHRISRNPVFPEHADDLECGLRGLPVLGWSIGRG